MSCNVIIVLQTLCTNTFLYVVIIQYTTCTNPTVRIITCTIFIEKKIINLKTNILHITLTWLFGVLKKPVH